MDIPLDLPLDNVDPALVEAMAARVVRRKVQDYGKRKAGPGRPKGSGKVPGSGRKAGSLNLWSPEFREHLNERAQPFELLADICAGREIVDGGTKRKPTLQERIRAAETITRKLVPDLSAGHMSVEGKVAGLDALAALSPFELARRVAFTLAQGIQAADDRAQQPGRYLPPAPTDGHEAPAQADTPPTITPPDRNDWVVSGLTISFAEPLGADRERWVIRHQSGRIAGSAIGRDNAEAMARRLGGGE